ncbi:MAG: hypothetical protein COV57_01075 [Candidatus Liptonbacteria bacterium CG11_big_fil_rev_8_21_14_0_20_35_14]|uniref:Cohesin domain-containing protein n=1 Tax=Candidatus Liptonbacteria bacterium CG11_big_fil_rev_8_21_14_0_20_35_14 TaxID=1974634 RepID=A0A2H0N844_9BACT|nr:MAG: hypothetical protein COV57_01075 [Candidatus Liptonbacteria bacterium CG11_big_fil_rev_8_21_14_0_20_35_14]
MKNIFKVLSLVAVLAIAMPVFAATSLSVSPATVAVNKGSTFVVTVSANASEKIGVGQVEMTFPAGVVKVTDFSWVAATSYEVPDNKIDNVAGKLVQVGGFQGGKEGALVLARVTFSAVGEGTGLIALTSGTDWFNKDNSDTVSTLPNVLPVTVKMPIPVVTTTVDLEPVTTITTAPPTTIEVEETLEPEIVLEEATTTDVIVTEEIVSSENTELLAQATESQSSSTMWIIIVLLVIAGGYVVYSKKKS